MCKQDNTDKHQVDDPEVNVFDFKQAILDSKCSSLEELNWIKICDYLGMGDHSKAKRPYQTVRGKETENSKKK